MMSQTETNSSRWRRVGVGESGLDGSSRLKRPVYLKREAASLVGLAAA